MKENKICSICGLELNDAYGNNAQPINNGRCCNDCNNLVIDRRINDLFRKKKELKEKEIAKQNESVTIVFEIFE